MFSILQNEYSDFYDNQVVLTYGAFNSSTDQKQKMKLLPKHLWIAKDLSIEGWNMFSFSQIPIEFKLPNNFLKIGRGMFYFSKLPNDFSISNSILKIGEGSFIGVEFASTFKLPSTVQTISQGAFFKAKLPIGFQIPSTVKFDGNPFNKSVDIPNAHWDKEDPNTGFPLPGATLVADA